jgi:hypothetical protein
MKIIHRISLRMTSTQRRELESLGVSMSDVVPMPGGDPFVGFDVSEEHPNWPTLQQRFREWGTADLTRTEFSEKEVAAAAWLVLRPDWHHGYPQPDEGRFGYREATYDLRSYCPDCGIGLKQVRPFRMAGEPKWGGNGILQLNWVFEEYFVTPQIWTSVFQPYGISAAPVLDVHGVELTSVVQLVVDREVDISISDLVERRCARCGRTKYHHVRRGPFPKLIGSPPAPMVKSTVYFGGGAAADKAVLVSRDLGAALRREKVRGAFVKPVADG